MSNSLGFPDSYGGAEKKHKRLGTRSEQLLRCMSFIVHQLEGDVLASYSLIIVNSIKLFVCVIELDYYAETNSWIKRMMTQPSSLRLHDSA